jgi:hypothetical protein
VFARDVQKCNHWAQHVCLHSTTKATKCVYRAKHACLSRNKLWHFWASFVKFNIESSTKPIPRLQIKLDIKWRQQTQEHQHGSSACVWYVNSLNIYWGGGGKNFERWVRTKKEPKCQAHKVFEINNGEFYAVNPRTFASILQPIERPGCFALFTNIRQRQKVRPLNDTALAITRHNTFAMLTFPTLLCATERGRDRQSDGANLHPGVLSNVW